MEQSGDDESVKLNFDAVLKKDVEPEEIIRELEKEYGVGWNNLEQHTAEQIFYHEYFQSILPLTWKDPSHKLCTYECQEMCGGGLHSKAWEASTNREEL